MSDREATQEFEIRNTLMQFCGQNLTRSKFDEAVSALTTAVQQGPCAWAFSEKALELEAPVRPRYQALCTKCGASRPLPEATEQHPSGIDCHKCDYTAFVVPHLFTAEEVNYLIKQALKEQHDN